MKKLLIVIITLTTLTLTGCNERRENVNINDIINSTVNSSSSTKTEEPAENSSTVEETSKVEESTSTSSEPSDPSFEVATPSSSSTTSKVEEPTSSSSKVESKPTETSSTTSSQKPATPSSSSTSKPSSSTTTSSSKPTEKPVEQPTHTHTFTKATCTTPATCTGCGVTQGTTTDHNFKNGTCTTCGKADPNYVAPHDCRTDGHVWEVTYRTTEPKWCVERHNVSDFGFDKELGDYNKFINNLDAMGIPGNSGSASINVQVWGTETYEVKTCTKCGNTVGAGTRISINPMGDWQYIPGQANNHKPGYEMFDTLFYDADNIPPEIIAKIKLFWETEYGMTF